MIKVEHSSVEGWVIKRVYFFGALVYERSVSTGIQHCSPEVGGVILQELAAR